MERYLRRKLPNGRFVGVTTRRSRHMAAIKGNGNKSTERKLRYALVRAGIKGWQIGPSDVAGKPDFYFRKMRIAVFVDGCFWHGCFLCGHVPRTNHAFWKAKIERNRARDRKVVMALKSRGIRVIRLWEHQLSQNIKTCLAFITQLID